MNSQSSREAESLFEQLKQKLFGNEDHLKSFDNLSRENADLMNQKIELQGEVSRLKSSLQTIKEKLTIYEDLRRTAEKIEGIPEILSKLKKLDASEAEAKRLEKIRNTARSTPVGRWSENRPYDHD